MNMQKLKSGGGSMKKLKFFILGICISTCLVGCNYSKSVDTTEDIKYDDDEGYTYNHYYEEDIVPNDLPYGSSEYITEFGFYIPGVYELIEEEQDDLRAWTPERMSPEFKQMIDELNVDNDFTFLNETALGIKPVVLCGTLTEIDRWAAYRNDIASNILCKIGVFTGQNNVYNLWPEKQPHRDAILQWNSIEELCSLFGVTYRQFNSFDFDFGPDGNAFYSLKEYDDGKYYVNSSEAYTRDEDGKIYRPKSISYKFQIREDNGVIGDTVYYVVIPNCMQNMSSGPSVSVNETGDGFPYKEIYIDYSYLCKQCNQGMTYIKDIDGLNYDDFPGIVVNTALANEVEIHKAVEYLEENENFDWISWLDEHGIEYQHDIDDNAYQEHFDKVIQKYFVGA